MPEAADVGRPRTADRLAIAVLALRSAMTSTA